jgi:hypothetical protein
MECLRLRQHHRQRDTGATLARQCRSRVAYVKLSAWSYSKVEALFTTRSTRPHLKRPDSVRHGLRFGLRMSTMQGHIVASGGQFECDLASDAPRCAGDHCYGAIREHHVVD